MRVLNTEFIADGTCELSGKSGECVKAVFDSNAPPAIVSTTHFIKLIRFHAHQEAKRAALATAKDRSAPGSP